MTRVKWKLETASIEFGLDRKTLTRRIKAANIEPDSTGCFSTKQICAAVFSDKEAAQTRDLMASAALKESKLAERDRKLIDADSACTLWEFYLVAARQVIERSSMTDDEKSATLSQLRVIPLDDYRRQGRSRSSDPEEGASSSPETTKA